MTRMGEIIMPKTRIKQTIDEIFKDEEYKFQIYINFGCLNQIVLHSNNADIAKSELLASAFSENNRIVFRHFRQRFFLTLFLCICLSNLFFLAEQKICYQKRVWEIFSILMTPTLS